MDTQQDWEEGEYARIQRALMAYSLRTSKISGKGNAMRCEICPVLEYAVKRFGEGAREEEIKSILLYGQNSY